MKKLAETGRCCGCMACADVCPVGAIKSSVDDCGFVYPSVDEKLCIDCNACMEICAFKNSKNTETNILCAYAYKLADRDELRLSTSGGAFRALSDEMLREGGVVFGACMDEDFTVLHTAAYDRAHRDAMRMSKYAQSLTDGIFSEVKKLLSDGKKVMFVGTPCQCGELRRYIGESDGLLVCDFLCHGVPSTAFFKAHIHYLEEYYHKTASGYLFRGKRYGWNHGIEEITFTDGSRKDGKRVQSFAEFFQSGVSLRESCRNCIYRSHHRPSDITLADFWGLKKVTGQEDREGVSLVLANSPKGRDYIERTAKSGSLTEVDVESVLYRVSTTPAKSRVDVARFWDLYKKEGYEGVVKQYAELSLKAKVKHEIKKRMLR